MRRAYLDLVLWLLVRILPNLCYCRQMDSAIFSSGRRRVDISNRADKTREYSGNLRTTIFHLRTTFA